MDAINSVDKVPVIFGGVAAGAFFLTVVVQWLANIFRNGKLYINYYSDNGIKLFITNILIIIITCAIAWGGIQIHYGMNNNYEQEGAPQDNIISGSLFVFISSILLIVSLAFLRVFMRGENLI